MKVVIVADVELDPRFQAYAEDKGWDEDTIRPFVMWGLRTVLMDTPLETLNDAIVGTIDNVPDVYF